MAEIRVEKKRTNPWPWIIGALAVALLIGVFLAQDDEELGEETGADETAVTAYEEPGVEDPAATTADTDEWRTGGAAGFLAFVQGEEPTADVGRAHEYTSEGITRLAGAIEERIEDADAQDDAVDERLEQMRQQASALQAEEDAGRHAAMAREAFVTGADLIATLNAGAAGEVRQAAEAIQPEQPLLEQTAEVRQFFDRAGAAIGPIPSSS